MMGEEEKVKAMKDCMDNALYNGCGTQIMFAIVVFVVFLLSSCATKSRVEYRDRVVDHYVTKVEKDTVIEKMHDSVYVNVYTRGDTVFQEKYIEKTKWRDRIVIKNDTCWRDSVITEYKETVKEIVKVPKIFKVSLIISILVIIFAIIKILRWLKVI